MQIFKKWWKKPVEISEFRHGTKHPDTDPTIFKNVWGWDLVRRVLKERCHECGYVLANEGIEVHEISYRCNKSGCACERSLGTRPHQLCGVCYAFYHSLYINNGLKNRDYFRNHHDTWVEEGKNGRQRMGL